MERIQTGNIYISRSGDTTYELVAPAPRGYFKTVVRCQEFGWNVTNSRAYFSTAHIAKQLESGNWTLDSVNR